MLLILYQILENILNLISIEHNQYQLKFKHRIMLFTLKKLRINIVLGTVLLTLLIVLSCEDDPNVDMKKLNDYIFICTDYYEYENGGPVSNDTLIYSFLSEDTILGIRKEYYRNDNGIDEYV